MMSSEAEWKKAARGKNAFNYPWGNSKPDDNLLNYNKAVGEVIEVGKYPSGASPYGALDMAGNDYEWVVDWYDERYYVSSLYFSPMGPETGYYRVVRGGGFGSDYLGVRAMERNFVDPIENYRFLGFRCASE